MVHERLTSEKRSWEELLLIDQRRWLRVALTTRDQPANTSVLKEGRLVTFNGMAYELKYPTDNEQSQCPAPVEQEKRQ